MPMLMVVPSHCYEEFSQLLPGIAWLDVSVESETKTDIEANIKLLPK